MHVIIVCDFAVPTGGSAKVAIESALALASAGARVRFVHAVAGRDPRLEAAGIACTCLDMPDVWERSPVAGAVAGIWNRQTAHALDATFAQAHADGPAVIHIHQWTRAFSPSVLRTALASRQPVAVTAHDYFLACPNGVYYRFERQAPCSIRPLSGACLTARCDPRSSSHKAIRVLRSAATAAAIEGWSFDVVHVSDRGRETLTPLLPSQLRHHRIDNPVDATQSPPAVITADAPFAFVGRLTREKGAVMAARAATRADRPIAFIGEGPAEAEIRAANPAAIFHGWQSSAWVAQHLASGAIRAVVAPSLWLETGPLTVYEAAAAGVPSIVSMRCGASERVRDRETGCVVAPDVESVAAAMTSLDTATAQRFGARAHTDYWAEPPSPAVHAARSLDLYESMLLRRSSVAASGM